MHVVQRQEVKNPILRGVFPRVHQRGGHVIQGVVCVENPLGATGGAGGVDRQRTVLSCDGAVLCTVRTSEVLLE